MYILICVWGGVILPQGVENGFWGGKNLVLQWFVVTQRAAVRKQTYNMSEVLKFHVEREQLGKKMSKKSQGGGRILMKKRLRNTV